MKNIVLILAVLLSASCLAQQAQNLDSKVTNVTLFLSGAQVTRSAQATLKAEWVQLRGRDQQQAD
jgi:hypothetical protein